MTGLRDTDARSLEVLFQSLVVLCESTKLELGHGLLVRLDVHGGGMLSVCSLCYLDVVAGYEGSYAIVVRIVCCCCKPEIRL